MDATLLKIIKQEEGLKLKEYVDSKGTAIGYGFNLKYNRLPTYIANYLKQHGKITETMANSLLNLKFRESKNFADTFKFNNKYKAILTLMSYQMGSAKVKKFKNMLRAMRNNNDSDVATEMRDSLWFQQTPKRVDNIISKFLTTGVTPNILGDKASSPINLNQNLLGGKKKMELWKKNEDEITQQIVETLEQQLPVPAQEMLKKTEQVQPLISKLKSYVKNHKVESAMIGTAAAGVIFMVAMEWYTYIKSNSTKNQNEEKFNLEAVRKEGFFVDTDQAPRLTMDFLSSLAKEYGAHTPIIEIDYDKNIGNDAIRSVKVIEGLTPVAKERIQEVLNSIAKQVDANGGAGVIKKIGYNCVTSKPEFERINHGFGRVKEIITKTLSLDILDLMYPDIVLSPHDMMILISMKPVKQHNVANLLTLAAKYII